jgi:uncharacterized protein YjbI with pentapeptide repeats
LIVLSILGYIFNWHWTGLVPEASDPKQHAKTLWDWLQLLIIPAVLAVAGYVINLTISRGEQAATAQRAQSEREAAEKRAETEHEIAQDNQREVALQAYIDKMSALLIKEHLGCELSSTKGKLTQTEEEVRKIAGVRTLTTLEQLDGKRKRIVLEFLYESSLINNDNKIIDLNGVNLMGVDHSKGNLIEADLSFANLSEADLNGADLMGVNLNGANLLVAKVTAEQLNKAKSLKGATMPV